MSAELKKARRLAKALSVVLFINAFFLWAMAEGFQPANPKMQILRVVLIILGCVSCMIAMLTFLNMSFRAKPDDSEID